MINEKNTLAVESKALALAVESKALALGESKALALAESKALALAIYSHSRLNKVQRK